MSENRDEIMLDLLCKKAVYGLTKQEEQQLAELQQAAGVGDQSGSFERAVTAIHLASVDVGEEMPLVLRTRILSDAKRHFGKEESPEYRVTGAEPTASSGWFGWLGWAFAAAASIALAFNLFYTPSTNDITGGGVGQTPTPELRLTPQQLRQQLIETAPDLARGSWTAGNVESVTPSGDIVWSDAKQSGYMRLQGLPVNDPGKETYQLWIFDETQSDKTPIDGGTFNVTETGEVIIPITAKLKPRNTKMYAITVEKPGGVVVSDRKRLVALANRET